MYTVYLCESYKLLYAFVSCLTHSHDPAVSPLPEGQHSARFAERKARVTRIGTRIPQGPGSHTTIAFELILEYAKATKARESMSSSTAKSTASTNTGLGWASAAPSALLCAAAFYCSSVASRRAFSADANAAPALRDVLHDRYAAGSTDHTDPASLFFCLPDRIACAVLACTLGLIFAHSARAWPACIREACLLLAATQFLRACVVGVTTFPSPVAMCRGAPDFRSIQQPCWIEIYCNDLMFSGHTSVNVASAMLWTFARVHPALKILWWAFVIGGCVISVITRDHYSADVIIALVITVLVGLLRRECIAAAFALGSGSRVGVGVGVAGKSKKST